MAASLKGKAKLHLKKEENPPVEAFVPGGTPVTRVPVLDVKDDENQARHMETRIVTTRKKGWLTTFLPWFVFFVIATAMFALRYGIPMLDLPLPRQIPEWLRMYGPFIAIGLHFVIVLAAFKDQIFSGIMCLLIPPYPYYYLFLVCDFFYLRAILAGIYVGIGWDSLLYVNAKTGFIIKAINSWIASGGGPV